MKGRRDFPQVAWATPPKIESAQTAKPRQPRTSGFSLVEMLVALVILAVGLVAVMRLFPIALQNSYAAQEKRAAADLAASRMNQARGAGGHILFRGQYDPRAYRALTAESAADRYYTSTVQRMASASQVYLQRVTFAVEKPGGRWETYVTYVTEP